MATQQGCSILSGLGAGLGVCGRPRRFRITDFLDAQVDRSDGLERLRLVFDTGAGEEEMILEPIPTKCTTISVWWEALQLWPMQYRSAMTEKPAGAGSSFSRLKMVLVDLFRPNLIVEHFRNVDKLGFSQNIIRANTARVSNLDESSVGSRVLPANFLYDGERIDLEAWLKRHWTTGLVVLKVDPNDMTKAKLVHERYWRGNHKHSQCVSWSQCKSIMSALIGIAVEKKLIDTIDDPVTKYAEKLEGSGFDGVPIKHVLEMRSGIKFDENYMNPFADLYRLGASMARGHPMDDLVSGLKRNDKIAKAFGVGKSQCVSGKYRNYISVNTQALVMVLKGALRKSQDQEFKDGEKAMSVSKFAEHYLWSKAGFGDDAIWLLDNAEQQTELGFGIFGATTRDYARLGWLYLNGGKSPATGEQVVPKEWVETSITCPEDPQMKPGLNLAADTHFFGYGYQWWLGPKFDDDGSKEAFQKFRTQPNGRFGDSGEYESIPGVGDCAGDYAAIGVYGQMIYVSPDRGVVIAKNAADPYYDSYAQTVRPPPGVSQKGFPEGWSFENLLENQGFMASGP